MHPAYSVILFTTASGAGYGLLTLLAVLQAAGVLENPIVVFLYAMAAGALYQLIFALIVIYVRVQPIIVSLSGYLALTGINLVILPRPGGISPDWMQPWGLGTSVLSPVLGAISDGTGRRMLWIWLFSMMYVGGSMALWWVLPAMPALFWPVFWFRAWTLPGCRSRWSVPQASFC